MPWALPSGPQYTPPPTVAGVLAGGLGSMGDRLKFFADQKREEERRALLDQRAVDWRAEDIGRDDDRFALNARLQYGLVPAGSQPPSMGDRFVAAGMDHAPEMAGGSMPMGLGDRLAGSVAPPPVEFGGQRYEINPELSVPGMVAARERGFADQDYRRVRADQLTDQTTARAHAEQMERLQAALRPAPQTNWETVNTDQGIFQVSEDGATRPVQTAGQTLQPRTTAPTSADERRAADALVSLRALAADPSPAGDLAFKTLYMKVLDPQSVVREGELDMLNNAGSLWERWKQGREDVETGMLTPERRQDMLRQAESILNARSSGQGTGTTDGAPTRENGLRVRAAQLKAEGKSEQEARQILQREGLL